MACGNRRVFIITPGPRYHSLPCCCKEDHCTHLQIPDSSLKLMQDLARLQLLISQRLVGSANCTVIPACDLLSGKRNTSPEEALATFASWGAVHGSNANYTRMALPLGDSYFRRLPAAPPCAAGAALSGAEEAVVRLLLHSGSEAGLLIPALSSFRAPRFKAPAGRQPTPPVFTRGGSRGGGNNPKRGFHGGSGSAGRSGR
jgi:hypothetical protein